MNSDSNEAPDLMNYWHTADYSSTVDAYNAEIERKDREGRSESRAENSYLAGKLKRRAARFREFMKLNHNYK